MWTEHGQLDTDELRRLVERVDALERFHVTGSAMQQSVAGTIIRPNYPERFHAQITGTPSLVSLSNNTLHGQQWIYPYREVNDYGVLGWQPFGGARSYELTREVHGIPALETNGNPYVPVGAVVEMRQGINDAFYLFEYAHPVTGAKVFTGPLAGGAVGENYLVPWQTVDFDTFPGMTMPSVVARFFPGLSSPYDPRYFYAIAEGLYLVGVTLNWVPFFTFAPNTFLVSLLKVALYGSGSTSFLASQVIHHPDLKVDPETGTYGLPCGCTLTTLAYLTRPLPNSPFVGADLVGARIDPGLLSAATTITGSFWISQISLRKGGALAIAP